jgi:hypothetical protein
VKLLFRRELDAGERLVQFGFELLGLRLMLALVFGKDFVDLCLGEYFVNHRIRIGCGIGGGVSDRFAIETHETGIGTVQIFKQHGSIKPCAPIRHYGRVTRVITFHPPTKVGVG